MVERILPGVLSVLITFTTSIRHCSLSAQRVLMNNPTTGFKHRYIQDSRLCHVIPLNILVEADATVCNVETIGKQTLTILGFTVSYKLLVNVNYFVISSFCIQRKTITYK